MAGVDYFIFGYRILSVSDGKRERLCNLFLKHHVRAIACDGGFAVSVRDFKGLAPFLSDTDCTVGPERGFPAFLKLALGRYLVTAALIIGIAVNLLSPLLVWDVRISGALSVPDYLIREALAASGLDIGMAWKNIDTEKVENRLLSDFEELAWVNVNRRGSVAYVRVVEKQGTDDNPEVSNIPSNLVASRDCVIEEISVHSGTAAVKVGDTVRKGEILISGVVTDSEGVTSLCRAEGVVRGKCTGTVEVKVPRKEEIKVEASTVLAEMRLNIFKLSLNIFKNYGNRDEECVIIEDNDTFVVFKDHRLPLGITRIYQKSFVTVDKSYTSAEMTAIGERRHSNALRMFLADAEPLGLKTESGFTDDGYYVRTRIVYSASVTEEIIIEWE